MVNCVHSVSQQKNGTEKKLLTYEYSDKTRLRNCKAAINIAEFQCVSFMRTQYGSVVGYFFLPTSHDLPRFIYCLSAALYFVALRLNLAVLFRNEKTKTTHLIYLDWFALVWYGNHIIEQQERTLKRPLSSWHFFPHIQDISNRHRRRCRLVLSFRIEKLTYFIYLNRNGGCKYFIAELQTMYSLKVGWHQTFKFYSQTIWILLDFFLLSLTQLKINGNGYGGGVCHVIQTFTLKLNFPIFFSFLLWCILCRISIWVCTHAWTYESLFETIQLFLALI